MQRGSLGWWLCPLLWVLLTVSLLWASPAHSQCVLDLVVLADGSGSITNSEFDFYRVLAEDMVFGFQTMAADSVRIGFVQYSFDVEEVSPITGDSTEFLEATRNMEQLLGSTFTGMGLEKAYEVFQESSRFGSSSVRKALLVITDGVADDKSLLSSMSTTIKNSGITVHVGGLGDIDESELQEMASSSDKVYLLNSFAELSSLIGPIQSAECGAASLSIQSPRFQTGDILNIDDPSQVVKTVQWTVSHRGKSLIELVPESEATPRGVLTIQDPFVTTAGSHSIAWNVTQTNFVEGAEYRLRISDVVQGTSGRTRAFIIQGIGEPVEPVETSEVAGVGGALGGVAAASGVAGGLMSEPSSAQAMLGGLRAMVQSGSLAGDVGDGLRNFTNTLAWANFGVGDITPYLYKPAEEEEEEDPDAGEDDVFWNQPGPTFVSNSSSVESDVPSSLFDGKVFFRRLSADLQRVRRMWTSGSWIFGTSLRSSNSSNSNSTQPKEEIVRSEKDPAELLTTNMIYVIAVVSAAAALSTTLTLVECILWRKMVKRTERKLQGMPLVIPLPDENFVEPRPLEDSSDEPTEKVVHSKMASRRNSGSSLEEDLEDDREGGESSTAAERSTRQASSNDVESGIVKKGGKKRIPASIQDFDSVLPGSPAMSRLPTRDASSASSIDEDAQTPSHSINAPLIASSSSGGTGVRSLRFEKDKNKKGETQKEKSGERDTDTDSVASLDKVPDKDFTARGEGRGSPVIQYDGTKLWQKRDSGWVIDLDTSSDVTLPSSSSDSELSNAEEREQHEREVWLRLKNKVAIKREKKELKKLRQYELHLERVKYLRWMWLVGLFMLLHAFTSISTSSMVVLTQYSIGNTVNGGYVFLAVVAFLLVTVGYPCLMIFLGLCQRRKLRKAGEKLNLRFGLIFRGLFPSRSWFYSIILLKEFGIVISLVAVYRAPLLQIIVIVIFHFAYLVALAFMRPMAFRWDEFGELVTASVMVFQNIVLALLIGQDHTQETRNTLTWIVIASDIFIFVVVGIPRSIYYFFFGIYMFRKILRERKEKKSKLAALEQRLAEGERRFGQATDERPSSGSSDADSVRGSRLGSSALLLQSSGPPTDGTPSSYFAHKRKFLPPMQNAPVPPPPPPPPITSDAVMHSSGGKSFQSDRMQELLRKASRMDTTLNVVGTPLGARHEGSTSTSMSSSVPGAFGGGGNKFPELLERAKRLEQENTRKVGGFDLSSPAPLPPPIPAAGFQSPPARSARSFLPPHQSDFDGGAAYPQLSPSARGAEIPPPVPPSANLQMHLMAIKAKRDAVAQQPRGPPPPGEGSPPSYGSHSPAQNSPPPYSSMQNLLSPSQLHASFSSRSSNVASDWDYPALQQHHSSSSSSAAAAAPPPPPPPPLPPGAEGSYPTAGTSFSYTRRIQR